MHSVSISDMDIRNVKRRELQALCKKHKIKANLTNLEMAKKLDDLLKKKDKPMEKGKSCMRSTLEQASENLSDGVTKLSKKVRFCPENEPFEFLASEIKADEIPRRARARRRSMMSRGKGIEGIVTEKNVDNAKCSEDNVNKPIKVTRFRGKKVADEVKNVVKTKGVKRGLRSVAFESVSMVETRELTGSLKTQEVEKKEEMEDDAVSWKNQTKRTLRKRSMKMDNEVSETEAASRKKTEVNGDVALKKVEPQKTLSSRPVKSGQNIMESEGVAAAEKVVRRSKRSTKQIEDYSKLDSGLVELEVVRRGRCKRQRAQLVEDIKFVEAAPKTEAKFEVVSQMEEPLRRSGRYGNRRLSVVPQTEKNSTDESKDETRNNTRVQGTSFDNAKPKRSSSRLKPVAFSDAIIAQNDINKKPRSRRSSLVLEEENVVIEGSSLVKEPPIRPTRNGKRRQSIMSQTEKIEAEKENVSKSSAVKENAKPSRKISSRQSIVASESTFAENVEKHKHKGRRMDSILEEENAVIEGSSVVEECPRKSTRKPKNLVTDGTGEAVKSKKLSSRSIDLHARSVPLEERISVVESGHGCVMNSTKVLSDILEEKSMELSGKSLGEKEVSEETVILEESNLEAVLDINTEDEADKDKVLQVFNSNKLAPESVVETNVAKDVDLTDASLGQSYSWIDQPDCLAKQVKNFNLETEIEIMKNIESETQASGSLEFQNDYEETGGMIAIEDDSDIDNLALLEPEVESKEDHSRIDQPDCLAKSVGNLDLGNKPGMSEENESEIRVKLHANEKKGVVFTDATLEDEGYPQIDQLVCLAKADENLESSELEMYANNDTVSHDAIDVENSFGTEEKHFVDPEVVLDSFLEKRTPGEVKGRKCHDSGKLTDFSSDISHDGVDFKNSYAREENHSVELEGVIDNSFGGKYTPSKVKGIKKHGVERSSLISELHGVLIGKEQPSVEPEFDEYLGYNVDSCSAHTKGIKNTEDFFENAIEEPKDSCVHISDRKEITSSKTKEMTSSEFENPAIIEPTNGVELTYKFEAEDHLTQDKGSILKENFEIVNDKNEDSDFLDSSDQNVITGFQVEMKQKDEVEISISGSELSEGANSITPMLMEKRETVVETLVMNSSSEVPAVVDPISLMQNISESVRNPSVTSVDNTSRLKELKHSIKTFSPISVSNETKRLMMVNLDWTSGSKFKNVHADLMLQEDHTPSAFPTVEPVEDRNKIINKNASLEDRQSPLSQEKSMDMSTGSFTLCENFDMERPESSMFSDKQIAFQATRNSGEQSRNQSFGHNCSTGPEDSKCKENDFDTGFNILSAENETRLFDATSPETTSIFADHQEGSTNNLTPVSEFRRVHTDSMLQEDHPPSAIPTVVPVEDGNKVINENINGKECQSNMDNSTNSFTLCEDFEMEKPETSLSSGKEPLNLGEQSRNQSFGFYCSTESEESEGKENEFEAGFNTLSGENETQPFEATSPQTTSGFAEHQGNGCPNIEVSPPELRRLFDDETQPNVNSGFFSESNDDDASKEGFLLGDNVATEGENNRKVVTEEEILGSFENKNEDTHVIRSFDNDDGFANTPCMDTDASPSALACSASASKSVHPIDLLEEENEGKDEMVSEQRHDDIAKDIMSPGLSDNLADEQALENATTYEKLTPVQNEEKHEGIVNACKDLEGVETEYDGMFDDLDGDEMEMVQELVHTEKDDSSCYSDQFLGPEKASVEGNTFEEEEVDIAFNDKANFVSNETSECEESTESSENLTPRADESHSHTRNASDMAQCVDESTEYADDQNFSKVSQCWSPDPEFGISQTSIDSNMFSSWELNMFSEGEATKSTPVGSKFTFAEEGDTGVDAVVNEETKACAASVTEVSGLERTETNEQCEAAKVADSAVEDKPIQFADGAAHGVVATEDLATDTYPLDKPEQLNSSSMTLDAIGADFNEEHFGSESNVFEGELRSDLEGEDVKEFDMFDDQSHTNLSLFPTEEYNAEEGKCAEVSQQATREMTPNESCSQELSEKVASTETEEAVVKKQNCDNIVQTDYLGEHKDVEKFRQDCTPNAAGDDSILISLLFDKGFATEDTVKNMDLVHLENPSGIVEKDELSSFGTTSKTLKIEKQSSLIRGTPKKLANSFDMKENATSVKRETIVSVSAKSTVKRRALSELHK